MLSKGGSGIIDKQNNIRKKKEKKKNAQAHDMQKCKHGHKKHRSRQGGKSIVVALLFLLATLTCAFFGVGTAASVAALAIFSALPRRGRGRRRGRRCGRLGRKLHECCRDITVVALAVLGEEPIRGLGDSDGPERLAL